MLEYFCYNLTCVAKKLGGSRWLFLCQKVTNRADSDMQFV